MSAVLVTGATGTVGREAVRALLEGGGAMVRALVRDPARAKLPSEVQVAAGDLRDATSVARALAGVSAALYVSPHEPEEEAMARSFAEACRRVGARVVFVGVHVDGPNRAVRALKRAAFGLMFRAYRSKFRLSEAVRQVDARATLLMPTNFFQNDELAEDVIRAGSYPMPMGTGGVNRVDVRDIGDVVARALTDEGLAGRALSISGPASLNGPQCAEVWSRALGRPVAFTGADHAAFAELAARSLRGKKLTDFVASHRLLSGLSMPTDPAEVAATTALLGRAPRSYESYVRDRVAAWEARPSVDAR